MKRPARRLRPVAFAPLIATLMMSGCANPGLERRDGYVADRTQVSSAFNQRIRYVVIHYTDSDEARALRTLKGPRVSAHYLISRRQETGIPTVRQLVDESRRAWHAGVSAWEDRTQLNDTSIGIEIVNAGPIDRASGRTWQPYPEEQIDAVIALTRDLVARYDLAPTAIVGHSDIAPQRKIDPGPRFPWYRLYQAGVGAWPRQADVARFRHEFSESLPAIETYQRALNVYGYALEADGEWDARTRAVTRAFQMHFRPGAVTGSMDAETAAIAWALVARYHPESLGDLAPLAVPRQHVSRSTPPSGNE